MWLAKRLHWRNSGPCYLDFKSTNPIADGGNIGRALLATAGVIAAICDAAIMQVVGFDPLVKNLDSLQGIRIPGIELGDLEIKKRNDFQGIGAAGRVEDDRVHKIPT